MLEFKSWPVVDSVSNQRDRSQSGGGTCGADAIEARGPKPGEIGGGAGELATDAENGDGTPVTSGQRAVWPSSQGRTALNGVLLKRSGFSPGRVKKPGEQAIGDVEADITPRPVQELVQRGLIYAGFSGDVVHAQPAADDGTAEVLRQ